MQEIARAGPTPGLPSRPGTSAARPAGHRFGTIDSARLVTFTANKSYAARARSPAARSTDGFSKERSSSAYPLRRSGLKFEITGGTQRVEFRVPKGTAMICEFVQSPGEKPWTLVLTTGLTSAFSMKFRSAGQLFRGESRYETTSTNVIEPIGLRAQYMTGTLFLKDGRPVAAVERILPGRILTLPSVTAEDQSLFVAVGASIFLLDWEARTYRR